MNCEIPEPIFALNAELAEVADAQRRIDIVLSVARGLIDTNIGTAINLCQRAIAIAGSKPELQAQLTECLHLQGTLFLNRADYAAALLSFSQAKALREAMADAPGVATEQCFIGISQAYVGLYPESLQNLRAALSVFEENDDLLMIAKSLNSIGHSYVLLGEFEKALPYLIKSVDLAREMGNKKAEVTALDSLCHGYLGLGDVDNALSCGLESVQGARSIGALRIEAENLLGLGSVYRARGDLQQAESCFQQSLALAREYGFRFAEGRALRKLGGARREQDQILEALSLLRESLAILHEIGDKQRTSGCLEDLAAVCKQAGDFETALTYYEQFHLAQDTIYHEQTNFRIKSLEIAYEVEQANKEKEIYYLRNVALQREIEERIKAQTAAELLAITDSLTGLFNRRHLLYLAEREMAQATRYQRPLSIVIFDIDFFKTINDNFGHAAGDKVLAIVSSHVRGCLRKSDVLGRYGGEEFVILLPQTYLQSARELAERIRKNVASLRIPLDSREVSITISAGIATQLLTDESDRLDQLLDRADQALYEAKETGRNRTVLYRPPALISPPNAWAPALSSI